MSDLLIPNIDESVLDRLRKRAAQRGASVEDEARSVLTASVDDPAGPEFDREGYVAELRAFRESLAPMPASYSSLDALHEGRAMHFDKRGE